MTALKTSARLAEVIRNLLRSRLLNCGRIRRGSNPLRVSPLFARASGPVFVGLCALALGARADVITVGVVSFDSIVPAAPNSPGINAFTIYNFTGTNSLPGTPDSALVFLDTSILINGTQSVDVGTVSPGSVQAATSQFPSTTLFADAQFSATLDTTALTIDGQDYVAASDQLTADLAPSTPPYLLAGTDFAVLEINASLAGLAAVPEPTSFWLAFLPLASLVLLLRRRGA